MPDKLLILNYEFLIVLSGTGMIEEVGIEM